MKNRWVQHFIDLAKAKAQMSRDVDTQVGAVLLMEQDMCEVSSGYNDLPRGVIHASGRNSRPLKYHFTAHAEANAIANAARLGRATKGSTLVTTMFPCPMCTCLIINAGVSKIITPPPDLEHYKYGVEFQYSIEMLREAGVVVSVEDFK